jgi:simple sugar transport system substrate-binding protein
LVGPYNDHGWSEAHYTAGLYVEKNLKSRMLYLDSLNADSRPNVTLEQAVNDMAAQGARLIFLTSDEFAADAYVVAQKHPTVTFIHVSGDHALKDKAPANVGNVMGRMEEGKMIAGCAAALATRTGYIGYLGPLINDETRRLANSAYLGARYCYEHYRRQNPAKLRFRVDWIGFWFNIPNVTFDPTQVTNQFFDQGADVVMSGIDTTEAIVVTGQRATAGEQVWVVPYDYERACEAAPQVCLGVPYFNWGPAYLKLARQVAAGNWKREWEWLEPDWQDINNRDTSAVGFRRGAALTAEQSAYLDKFIAGLANRSIILFKGPLNFQNGQIFLNDKELASDTQIWYMPHLLAGMEGLSE